MSQHVILFLAPYAGSREAAHIADKLECKVVDPSCLFDCSKTTQQLGSEHNFCLTSHVAWMLAQHGRAIVLGPIKQWGKYKKNGVPPLLTKIQRMLCTRQVQFVVLEEGGMTNDDITWLPKTIMHPGPVDNFTLQSLPLSFSTTVVACNQVRVIYFDEDDKARHETVLFDAFETHPVLFGNLPTLPKMIDAERIDIWGPCGCSLILLPPRVFEDEMRKGQHLTLHPGKDKNGTPRLPATMRAVAKALERGDAVCSISENDILDLSHVSRGPTRVRPLGWALDAHLPHNCPSLATKLDPRTCR